MKKISQIFMTISILITLFAVFTSNTYADQLNEGVYNFECVSGGRYLNVYAGNDWDGANVCVWEKDGSPEQNFKMVDRGGNRYVLYPQSSNGRVLDANRGNSYSNPLQAGNNIDIWQTNDAPAQEWYIDDRGNGRYTIELVNARGLVVSCDNPGSNGGNCSLQVYTGSENQLWYLKRVDGGAVKPSAPASAVTTVPTPAPTSAPVNSEYKTGIYSVKYQGTNLRSGAGLDYSVITTVNAGTELNITDVSGEWGKTNYNGQSCWIRLNGFADFIREASIAAPIATPEPTPVPTPVPETSRTGYVYNTGGIVLNVRAQATTNSAVLGKISEWSSIIVKGNDKINGFWKVDYNGQAGYCYGDYITFDKPTNTNKSLSNIRTSAPEKNNKYYYSNSNVFYACGFAPYGSRISSASGNCTWYAWGRAYELVGKKPQSGFTGHAYTWWDGAAGKYSRGSTPKVGAIAVWKSSLPGSGGCGHVAVVEKIENGKIYISESIYPNVTFRYKEIYSTNYLCGYIYLN